MLTIAFDGTNYHGWQIQPNGLTVQQCVEEAIARLTETQTRVLCASRTDSGVHAIGQVACFHTDSKIPAAQFRRGLQRFLPEDISIVRSQQVSPDFHATFSAIRKRYRYLLYDGHVMSPFLRHRVSRSKKHLDVAAMKNALPHLLGKHDFRCFESQWPNKATSVRTIMDATMRRVPHWDLWNSDSGWLLTDPRPHEDPDSPLICFEIMADGFLYNMVRAIVGTLLDIGCGRKASGFMKEVVDSQDRSMAGSTAPASGLYLLHVEYPPEQLIAPEEPPCRNSHQF